MKRSHVTLIGLAVLLAAVLILLVTDTPWRKQPGQGFQENPLTRIAFGSCSSIRFAQPIWNAVHEANPELWIWAGDAIYADSTDINRFHRLYKRQKNHPGYKRLRQVSQIIGTWDDHDYGANNVGKEFPIKQQTQQAFLDFLGVDEDDPRRQREGVYASHSYGPPGKRLKVILLDTRYHRDPPGPEGDMLGETQWQWLESELADKTADLFLLVSSTNVTTKNIPHVEGWFRFPRSQKRLGSLLGKTPAPVVVLTGDLHFAEITKFEHPSLEEPLYEIMSSGLTHPIYNARYENDLRVGPLYTGQNFGFIEIEWGSDAVVVDLQIRDAENKVRNSVEVTFDK